MKEKKEDLESWLKEMELRSEIDNAFDGKKGIIHFDRRLLNDDPDNFLTKTPEEHRAYVRQYKHDSIELTKKEIKEKKELVFACSPWLLDHFMSKGEINSKLCYDEFIEREGFGSGRSYEEFLKKEFVTSYKIGQISSGVPVFFFLRDKIREVLFPRYDYNLAAKDVANIIRAYLQRKRIKSDVPIKYGTIEQEVAAIQEHNKNWREQPTKINFKRILTERKERNEKYCIDDLPYGKIF